MMKISHTLGGSCSTVCGRKFPMNSVVIDLEDGRKLVCTTFLSYKNPLQAYYYASGKWYVHILDKRMKDIMWTYYRKNIRQHHSKNYSKLMKHERKRKNGGGGSLINNRAITDYECTKNPLHDFRRVYI